MADDMYRFGKKNTNEPKPKKPEEIKQEKFDKIVKDVADMDAEIEKLRQVIKAQSKVQYDYLNKLAAEINASDELPENDKAKLTQTALDAKIKEFNLKEEANAKYQRDARHQVSILVNKRADLDSQYGYINGTRFEYSNNINEKRSKVSVTLYGIIQEGGRIIANDPIAISKEVRYKKGVTDDKDKTGLPYIKENLKKQLIEANIELIRSRYNVWIDPNEVTDRTDYSQLPSFDIPSTVIQEEAEAKKFPKTGSTADRSNVTPYTVTAAESKAMEETYSGKGKSNQIKSFVTTEKGLTDMATASVTEQLGLDGKSSKYENQTKESINPADNNRVQGEPTAAKVTINQNTDNINLITTKEENKKMTTSEWLTYSLNKMKKLDISSYTRMIATNEGMLKAATATSSQKAKYTNNITKLREKLDETVKEYNKANPTNPITPAQLQEMISNPSPAKSAEPTSPAAVIKANADAGTSGSYVETGNVNINPINTSVKEQLGLTKNESQYNDQTKESTNPAYANQRQEPTPENVIGQTTLVSDNGSAATNPSSQNIAEDGLTMEQMDAIAGLYITENKTGDNNADNSSTSIVQNTAITKGTGEKILQDPLSKMPTILNNVGGAINNLANVTNQGNTIYQPGDSQAQAATSGTGTTQTINNNMQQQLTGTSPQSAEAPPGDTPEPVDSSQYFVLMINALHELNATVQTGIKVRGIPA